MHSRDTFLKLDALSYFEIVTSKTPHRVVKNVSISRQLMKVPGLCNCLPL